MIYIEIVAAEQRWDAEVKRKRQKKFTQRNSSGELRHDERVELEKGEEEIRRLRLQGRCYVVHILEHAAYLRLGNGVWLTV
jgi:hypothetical protein